MRLDAALVARGLARSRGQASDLITAGKVQVNGQPARKASAPVTEADRIDAETDPWVSRAAHKLLGALDACGTTVTGRALDAGASTGGFTQVLLDRGCAPVYAVDVGHGQLAPAVASDPRVIAREGLNVRDLTLADVGGEPVDVIVADLSFISLTLLVVPLRAVAREGATAILLVKPQFELGRAALDSRGVVADRALAASAVDLVAQAASEAGWAERWRGPSTLAGESGNQEYVLTLVAITESSAGAVRLAP
ncbi:MAG: TlyA family RNA methyltransferase [Propioniciclava sp.]|uniref:TlyA family RNA methyltransferase n=1 Tax=Propioniciclava sp. TaxID=2038686 RepID=UPI0039E3EBB7